MTYAALQVFFTRQTKGECRMRSSSRYLVTSTRYSKLHENSNLNSINRHLFVLLSAALLNEEGACDE